ncbi:TPA: hypothetical protein ACQK1M_002086 [Enterococcus hirae]
MKNYQFYYDESEHSRKINSNTITSENFYDNFVSVIVGWNSIDQLEIEHKYLVFEDSYEHRKIKGELKSSTFKNRQFKYGFSSLSKDNVILLKNLFSLFDNKIYVYYSIRSKTEYVILQILNQLQKDNLISFRSLVYSVTKSLIMYKPKKILDGIGKNETDFLNLLINFFEERIDINKTNLELKQKENLSFLQNIILLKNLKSDIDINWDYEFSFIGFMKYLEELSINNSSVSLFIDKEGNEKTLNAAKDRGFSSAKELLSEESVGIRISDMLAGIITKILKSIRKDLAYQSDKEVTTKKTLNSKWFKLNEDQFFLYKELFRILSQLNNAYYKSFTGIYADDFLLLIGFLSYINSFENYIVFTSSDANMPEEVNTIVSLRLNDYFREIF